LDPTSEYHYGSWEVFSSLTSRTLVTYRHISGPEGNELVPDLAVAVPQPTDGGLTYTFELKPGIMFGPPLNRAVTSRDIAYSFERMVCDGCYGAYDFYFRGTIRGMRRGEDHISGIETPDPNTIVFHLKRATGDFVHRLALPATGPIPQEVAGCRRTGTYGRRLVATGPYMLEGSETATLGENCRSVEPFGGYNAEDGSLHLVRNPNYDPATDSLDIRNPRFDQFFFEKLGPSEAFRQIQNNEKDGALLEPSPRRIERYLNDGDDEPMLHSHAADTVWYVTMNLTQRPFDDVHVRRAFNLALDKAAVQDAWGDITGSIATHVLPPTLTGGYPTADEYDPYATAGHAGDIERAREEMSRSRYDRDDDGRCDVAACESVRLINRDTEPWISAEPFVLDALRSIGIEADVRRARWVNAYTMISDLSRGIPLGMNPGWGKDYADSGTYFRFLMHSSSFKHCPYTVNYSVIGGSEMKKRCNGTGNFEDLPNIDPDIEACEAIADEVERDSCWVDLDATVMEEVVPWVPMIWRNNVRVTGPGIGDYEFDQSTGEMSLAHIGP
jgi:peptide/nickel transport system substrate-binding protein